MSAPEPAPQDEAPNFPRAFGRYVLLEGIPGGGMGEVALAVTGSTARRLCVIKTVRADHAHHLPTITRFLDEGRLLAALTHPNIAQILEAGTEGSTPFVAMEFISGVDLDIVMRMARSLREPLPLDFVVTVIAHALEAVYGAASATSLDGHPLGIVHRDLGPPNVRLSWDGTVKVLDFGTALATGRATQTLHGVMFGRPEYASPEQCRGDDLDTRSDLYTLGVVTWEMLAGRDFASGDGTEHMIAVAQGRRPVPSLRAERADLSLALDRWIATMTAFEPTERFADAATARRRLLDLAQGAGVRVDRECVARELQRFFPGAREEEAERVRELVARAPAPGGASTRPPPRAATTEPMGQADANLLRGTRYRTGAVLGRGGMGTVWAAEHIDLGRTVAVKVLDPESSSDPQVVERFRLEARTIAALTHPNLVHIYDLGSTEDGRLFYAMERLRGRTLRERLDAARAEGHSALPAAECLHIGTSVALGLAAAHAVGVVHRDIKPENIFLTEDGGVKLLDFGVAKTNNAAIARGSSNLTFAGQVFGTPAYMSPEQARGLPVDHRADLYALGAVLYECATGSVLFPEATPVETMAQHIHATPVPLRERAPHAGLAASLESAVMRCLAKDPAARFPSAKELIDALTTASRAPAPRAGRARAVGVALGVVTLLGAVASLALWQQLRAAPGASRAERVVPDPLARQGLRERTVAVPAAAVAPPVIAVDAGAERGTERDAGAERAAAPVARARAMTVDAGEPAGTAMPAEAPGAEREDYYTRARREFAAGRAEQAAALAQEAIRRRQHQRRSRNLYGQSLLLLGRRAEAIRQWRMVLEMDPDNDEARRLLRAADADEGPR